MTSTEPTIPGSAGTPQATAGVWTRLANASREPPSVVCPSVMEVSDADLRAFHSVLHLQMFRLSGTIKITYDYDQPQQR